MPVKITGLTAASAASATDLVPVVQSSAGPYKMLMSQIGTFVRALFTTTPATVVEGGTGAATAAGARTNLGATTIGASIFTAATVAAERALITPLTTKGDLWGFSSVDARQAVGTDGQALSADSSQTAGLVYIDNPSRPNLLINPNWQIDQINEGALYTYSATSAVGPDGWSGSATGAGVFKLRTLADPDNAALKCLEISCTTADASIAAGDNYYIYTTIEGYDAAALMAGTASAQSITIQFKAKSNSVTGVVGVAIQNSAGNRRYIGIITIPDTSEHDYSVTLALDTSGTWLYTNGIGLKLILTLAAGSTFQGTAGAWAAGAEQTTSAQMNFMSVNTNILYLKRIQLIPGALVQAYRPADIQKELAKCQRYYYKTFSQGTAPVAGVGVGTAGTLTTVTQTNNYEPNANWLFRTSMRAAPTITLYNPRAGGTAGQWGSSGGADSANARVSYSGTEGAGIDNTANLLAANAYWSISATANARLS